MESFDRPQNVRAKDEKGELAGHHSENLYDQNEDGAGEKADLGTGRAFVNDRDVDAFHHLDTVDPADGHDDVLPPLDDEDDAAAQWLRANGG